MKLRNKQTGEVIILIDHIFDDYTSLAELNEEWEDCIPTEPKHYRLLKDLPTFKEGDEFFTDENGSLWLEQNINGEPNTSRVKAYHKTTLDKFPNILTDWFEPIDGEDTNGISKEHNDDLSREDWARICECIRRTIAEKTKTISQKMDEYSCQYVWNLATDAFEDFELLSKVEEMCGEEE